MSMERRALIAFVASMLLFLAYDALYLGPQREKAREARIEQLSQQQEARRADSLQAVARGDVLEPPEKVEQEAVGSDATLVPYAENADTAVAQPDVGAAPEGEPVLVTVASDVFAITLTSRGGEVVSARMLNYLTDGQPVEFFPQNPGWTFDRVLNVDLVGEQGNIPLNRITFQMYDGGAGEPLPDGTRLDVDTRSGQKTIVLRGRTADGRMVERTYTFRNGHYDFEAGVRFAQADFPSVIQVAWDTGPGMTSTEKNVKDDHQSFRANVLLGEEMKSKKPNDFGKKSTESYSGTLNWFSIQTKYFTTALVPPEPVRADVVVAGSKEGQRVTARAAVPATVSGGRVDQTMRVYMGPVAVDYLEELGVGLERTVQLGWKFIRPVSVLVLWSIKALHKVIPNYGWVIIIISVLTKVLFFRLTHKSFKSMKELQELQPRINAIKEKFKGDQQKISQETMRLYKEAGVNPLGGCLPLVLQMPVFIALFNVLKFTIQLRGASFIGWITDLSQPEVLFRLPISLPLVGDAFSLLPILMGASMVAQSKLGGSPTGGASTAVPPGFNTLLPIVFTFLFYSMPSGLVLYWIVNTVLSVAQQYYIHRESKAAKDNASADAPATTPAKPARPPKRRLKAKGR
jgi:YidC/Oxa1 family membrane protein insertase